MTAELVAAVLEVIWTSPLEDVIAEVFDRGPRSARPSSAPSSTQPRTAADEVADALREVVGLLRRSATGMRAADIRRALSLDPRSLLPALREGVTLKVLVASGRGPGSTTYRARERPPTG